MSTDVDLKKKKAFEFYAKKEYQKAQYLLEDLIGNVRGTKDAEKVYFYYAYTHYNLQNYTFASYYFKQFSSTFPYGEYAEEALYMSADAFYRLSPNHRLTQEDTKNAVEGLQTFVNTYPNSSKVDSCNELIDDLRAELEKKDLESAKGYFHRKHYKAAKHVFTSLLVSYPDSRQAEYIRQMIIKSSFRYAQESILAKQIERYQETINYIEQFQKRYPESKYKKEIESINSVATGKIKKIRNEL
jgi:outer membrane protein assembly factor BamD